MRGASALILNGGSARRMSGVDKSQIRIAGESILQRQWKILSQRFSEIAMVGDGLKTPDGMPINVLDDRVGGQGPIDGIAAGLAWCQQPWLFVLAGDMPFPQLQLIDAILENRSDGADIVCVDGPMRAQPLFTAYQKRLLPELDARLAHGALRVLDMFEGANSKLEITRISEAEARRHDPELMSFRNLNRPEDVLTSGGRIE